LKSLAAVLGLLQSDPEDFLQVRAMSGQAVQGFRATGTLSEVASIDPQKIDELIAARTAARKTRNFAEADRIRKELLDAGIVLEDTPQGTTWRRA
jgi:cysteinyl-tRNA synthetase